MKNREVLAFFQKSPARNTDPYLKDRIRFLSTMSEKDLDAEADWFNNSFDVQVYGVNEARFKLLQCDWNTVLEAAKSLVVDSTTKVIITRH